ncbi:hypothetical protein [Streptomyces botrytidirepellens]|uniref:hypothetical protein n=1 Tax=Streptomyces botrytidirepellens TaxID=2486417 RepID=UPI00161FEC10|nr:hypothetical protein [Streptomyces botrytidirepellens]
MITNAEGRNSRHKRWHRLQQVRSWVTGRTRQGWANLPKLWRHETVRHMAFSAGIILAGAWLLGQVVPHVPGWAAAINGTLATIDQPVRHYLLTHTQALPITASATYSVWQAVGFASFVTGVFYNGPARLAWTMWGATTVIMVWIGTPDPGRQVAAGLALLAWVALSGLALRGLRLRPAAFVQVDVHNEAPPPPEVEVRAEIHTTQPEQPQYLPPSPN